MLVIRSIIEGHDSLPSPYLQEITVKPRSGLRRLLPIDMMRYVRGFIHAEDIPSELNNLSSLRICKYSPEKSMKSAVSWGLGHWEGYGWTADDIDSFKCHGKTARQYSYYAVLTPITNADPYKRTPLTSLKSIFPFELMQLQEACCLQEIDSSELSHVLYYGDIQDLVSEPIVIRRLSPQKDSRRVWDFGKWDVSGWHLEPIKHEQHYDYRK